MEIKIIKKESLCCCSMDQETGEESSVVQISNVDCGNYECSVAYVVGNNEVLNRTEENRTLLDTVLKKQGNLMGHDRKERNINYCF